MGFCAGGGEAAGGEELFEGGEGELVVGCHGGGVVDGVSCWDGGRGWRSVVWCCVVLGGRVRSCERSQLRLVID